METLLFFLLGKRYAIWNAKQGLKAALVINQLDVDFMQKKTDQIEQEISEIEQNKEDGKYTLEEWTAVESEKARLEKQFQEHKQLLQTPISQVKQIQEKIEYIEAL